MFMVSWYSASVVRERLGKITVNRSPTEGPPCVPLLSQVDFFQQKNSTIEMR